MQQTTLNNIHSSKLGCLLNELDWDSSDNRHYNYSLNQIHWYPATFIPNVPANLIEVFSQEDDLVWDPFCGSGNSGVEALKRGRKFIGNDINEIAVMISNAKLTLLAQHKEVETAFHCLKKEFHCYRAPLISYSNIINSKEWDINYEELAPWYDEIVFEKLKILYDIIKKPKFSEEISNFFMVLFLTVARFSCAQRNSWGHIADNVKPSKDDLKKRKDLEIDPIKVFEQRVQKVIKKGKKLCDFAENKIYSAQISNENSMCFSPSEKVDLVLTSPPYPWMCDYITSQRLAFYWLGKDIKQVQALRNSEIGPRSRRGMKARGEMYSQQMAVCFTNIVQHLKSSGHLCLVYPKYDEGTERYQVLQKTYEHLSTHLDQVHLFTRNLSKNIRSSPFTTLQAEEITIWKK